MILLDILLLFMLLIKLLILFYLTKNLNLIVKMIFEEMLR